MRQQTSTVAEADERLASLRAAIQVGVDDVDADRVEEIHDPAAWVQAVADTVTVDSAR